MFIPQGYNGVGKGCCGGSSSSSSSSCYCDNGNFLTFLHIIYSLSLTQNTFIKCGRRQKLFLLLGKRKISSVGNCRLVAISNNFSEVLEFVIHDQVSHFRKPKLWCAYHHFNSKILDAYL
jgi:hypothetical protein